MISIKAIINLSPAFKSEVNRIDYYEEAVDDLVNSSNKFNFSFENHINSGNYQVQISAIKNYSRKYYTDLNKYWSSQLIFEIEVDNFNYDPKHKFESKEEQLESYKYETAHDFRHWVFHIMVISHLARPGALKAGSGRVYANDIFLFDSFSILSLHRDSYEFIEEMNWIKYSQLSVLDVWNWYNKNGLSFIRVSNKPIEIAFNAFSMLFNKSFDNINTDLLWALTGIECLFCSNKEGISQQIFEKSQVIFGQLTDFKKRLKIMYNTRSSFVHGSLNIPPNNFEDYTEKTEKYEDLIYESASLAVAILTGTIQFLILHNRIELSFSYQLND